LTARYSTRAVETTKLRRRPLLAASRRRYTFLHKKNRPAKMKIRLNTLNLKRRAIKIPQRPSAKRWEVKAILL
jgi:hypothetical protein